MYRRHWSISAVALAGLLAWASQAGAQEKKEGAGSGQHREGASGALQREGSGSAQQRQGTAKEQMKEGAATEQKKEGAATEQRREGAATEQRREGEVRSGGNYNGPYYGGRAYGRGFFGPRYGYYGNGYYSNGYYYGDGYYEDGGYSFRPRRFIGRGWADYDYGLQGPAPYYSYGTPYATYPSPDCDTHYGSTRNGYAYGAMNANSALIDVKVAPDAQIFFDDAQTKQTGEMRQFITPPLEPSKDFSYMVRARWKEGDRDMDDSRKVKVRAGAKVKVDFTLPQNGSQEIAPKPEAAPRPGERDIGAPPPDLGQPAPLGDQANLEFHEGQFLSFREGTLEMSDLQGKKHSHHLAPGTSIIIDGKPAKPEDLKADMKLKVSTKKGDPQTVTKIEVMSQPKQGEKRPLDLGAPPPLPKP